MYLYMFGNNKKQTYHSLLKSEIKKELKFSKTLTSTTGSDA